jgi:hypothetical protein
VARQRLLAAPPHVARQRLLAAPRRQARLKGSSSAKKSSPGVIYKNNF